MMKKLLGAVIAWAFAAQLPAQLQMGHGNEQQMESFKMTYVLGAINNLYVDTVNMHKLLESAIVNTLKELDPHSAYIPKEELQRTNEPLEGKFEGIGIQFQLLEDTLFVVQTISGCPAERVGVRAGDRIVAIEDSVIAGVKIKNSDIMRRLRGKKGTTVHVSIKRSSEPELLEFAIVRDKIPIYSVDAAYMATNNIGYIKINNFGASTHQEFCDSWAKLKKEGAKSLILDLQGNGGGYLSAAIDLADEFLPNDRPIVYTQGEHQSRVTAKASAKGNCENVPLAILVDEYSASASEIVSGAIQDWDRGIIVGRRTFGKGLVQRQLPLPDGSAMRLTTARYYTPSGRCIQKPYKGIDYSKDLEMRYKHGELMHADSIHFPDSLKYATLRQHRTVYGGGGIMPDLFVPADTSLYSVYHRKIVGKGIMNKTCVQYIDQHRAALHAAYATFDIFQKRFTVDEDFLQQLIKNAEVEKIAYDDAQFQVSKEFIQLQAKALIARDLWSMQEYFRIINTQNDSFQKAIDLLSSSNTCQQMLK